MTVKGCGAPRRGLPRPRTSPRSARLLCAARGGRQAGPRRWQSLRTAQQDCLARCCRGRHGFPRGEVEAPSENHLVHRPLRHFTDGETEACGGRGRAGRPLSSLSSAGLAGCLRLLVALFIVGLSVGCVPGCLFMGGEVACIQSAGGGVGREATDFWTLQQPLQLLQLCPPQSNGHPLMRLSLLSGSQH